MDVRCERCKTEYRFDEGEIGPGGLTIQCSSCNHVFTVRNNAPAEPAPVESDTGSPGSEPSAGAPNEIRIRLGTGQEYTCPDRATLQKWIAERRLGREDEVQLPGEPVRRFDELHEFDVFFDLVAAADEAAKPRTESAPSRLTATEEPAPEEKAPLAPRAVEPTFDEDFFAEAAREAAGEAPDDAEHVDLEYLESALRPTHRLRNALLVAGLLFVGAGLLYAFYPDLAQRLAGEQGEKLARAPLPPTPARRIEPSPAPPAPSPAPPPQKAPAQAPPTPPRPAEAKAQEPTPQGTKATEPTPLPAPARAATPAPAAPLEATSHAQPPGPRSFIVRAEKLRNEGELVKAVNLYNRAIGLSPRNVAALSGRGLCYLDLDLYSEALKSFGETLRIDPRNADALLGTAEAYRSLGRTKEAMEAYEKYLAAHPDGEEAPVARNALEQLRR